MKQVKEVKHTSIDTETIEGKAVLICTPKRSLIYPQTFEEIANFLFTTKAHEAHHIWTFNLTYDVYAICKFLPDENLIELYKDNETIYNDYKVFFIPSKVFSITKNKDKATLVDAQQFFSSSLDAAAKTFLGEGKNTNEIIEEFKNQEGKSKEYLYKFFDENKDVLIEYCKKDAYLTAELGKKVDTSCFETYNFRMETYSSNAKVGEKATLTYLEKAFQEKGIKGTFEGRDGKEFKSQKFPKADLNTTACKFALESFRGGIFETWRRGKFGNVTDLDINSAYPYHMNALPHWANGSFSEITEEEVNKLNGGDKSYEYGWVACSFDCSWIPYDSKIPIRFTQIIDGVEIEVVATASKIFYPKGQRRQIITLDEFYFMRKYNFPCLVLCGYIWKRKEEGGYKYPSPFAWIPTIYDMKTQIKKEKGSDAKKDMNYLQCKIGMNGTYGKTVQSIGDIKNKPLYSPFYGSYITAKCRIQIASFILDNKLEDKVISIATDGILLEGTYVFPSSELLGEWDVNHYDSALVIGNGMLQLNKKQKDGSIKSISRMRGITNKQDVNIISILEGIREKNEYTSGKRRPIKLGECIAHSKTKKISDLNTFILFEKKLRLNADRKRRWLQLNCWNDLLTQNIKGESWTVDEIEEKEYMKGYDNEF